ncbi:hypothetical protein Godav_019665 [Gossypium davidsonii]|uniref:Uncharacterized protein n=1 Tax=Gossypium davidsonii TaxID=34287 RepID=A0A7J8R0L9_GOSDV|nr:hypothetical protein [Gossypium davidsonii]
MDLVLSLIREISMKNTNQSLKKGEEKEYSTRKLIEEDLFNHIGKGIIDDVKDKLQENDLAFL